MKKYLFIVFIVFAYNGAIAQQLDLQKIEKLVGSHTVDADNYFLINGWDLIDIDTSEATREFCTTYSDISYLIQKEWIKEHYHKLYKDEKVAEDTIRYQTYVSYTVYNVQKNMYNNFTRKTYRNKEGLKVYVISRGWNCFCISFYCNKDWFTYLLNTLINSSESEQIIDNSMAPIPMNYNNLLLLSRFHRNAAIYEIDKNISNTNNENSSHLFLLYSHP